MHHLMHHLMHHSTFRCFFVQFHHHRSVATRHKKSPFRATVYWRVQYITIFAHIETISRHSANHSHIVMRSKPVRSAFEGLSMVHVKLVLVMMVFSMVVCKANDKRCTICFALAKKAVRGFVSLLMCCSMI